MRPAFVILLVVVSGCAIHPGNILPEPVSVRPYQALSCGALEATLADTRDQLAAASERQMDQRTVGGIRNAMKVKRLFGIVIDDREESRSDVARRKGEVGALIRELDRRC